MRWRVTAVVPSGKSRMMRGNDREIACTAPVAGLQRAGHAWNRRRLMPQAWASGDRINCTKSCRPCRPRPPPAPPRRHCRFDDHARAAARPAWASSWRRGTAKRGLALAWVPKPAWRPAGLSQVQLLHAAPRRRRHRRSPAWSMRQGLGAGVRPRSASTWRAVTSIGNCAPQSRRLRRSGLGPTGRRRQRGSRDQASNHQVRKDRADTTRRLSSGNWPWKKWPNAGHDDDRQASARPGPNPARWRAARRHPASPWDESVSAGTVVVSKRLWRARDQHQAPRARASCLLHGWPRRPRKRSRPAAGLASRALRQHHREGHRRSRPGLVPAAFDPADAVRKLKHRTPASSVHEGGAPASARPVVQRAALRGVSGQITAVHRHAPGGRSRAHNPGRRPGWRSAGVVSGNYRR